MQRKYGIGIALAELATLTRTAHHITVWYPMRNIQPNFSRVVRNSIGAQLASGKCILVDSQPTHSLFNPFAFTLRCGVDECTVDC